MIEKPLDTPLNTEERYLHAICVRLDAVVHMLSSLLEEYAKQGNITTTSNKIEEKPAPKKSEEKPAPKKSRKK